MEFETTVQRHKSNTNSTNGPVVETILHMNSGNGQNSYAQNSSHQRETMLEVRPILEESVEKAYVSGKTFSEHFAVADLGCSSGPNTLVAISIIIEAIGKLRHRTGEKNSLSEILVFLNDIPGNDFNSVFALLPSFYEKLKKEEEEKGYEGRISSKCFVSAMPGSFYGRLFPSRSLHLVHSSYSLHWLSQVPEGLDQNKGNVFIGTTSPKEVWEAYLKQFQRDFTMFLSSRAMEIVPSGQMVLTLAGRATSNPRSREYCFTWDLLAESLLDMAAEGLVAEADIDSFNFPVYVPCKEEVRDAVKTEGSFTIDKLETVEHTLSAFENDESTLRIGERMSQTGRAFMEPILTYHFGGGQIMDDLFERFARKLDEHLSIEIAKTAYIVISVARKEMN